MTNKLDKNTFSGYLALSGCMIQPKDLYTCVDIDLCELKMSEISDVRLKKKTNVSQLKSISNYKSNLYQGSVIAAYKMLVLLEYQEDIAITL